MKQIDFDKLFAAIDIRFKNAKFSISCFKTIDEIDSKKLCDDSVIIIRDLFIIGKKQQITNKNNNKITNKIIETNHYDYFIVKESKIGNGIYYKDVIDELIKNNFNTRETVDHKFLEGIGEIPENKQKLMNSVSVFGFGWGS